MPLPCNHPLHHLRPFTLMVGAFVAGSGGTVCTSCGMVGEGSRYPDRAPPEHYPDGARSALFPLIHGREAILLRVGGVKRLAVVWERQPPKRFTPMGRLLVRVWQPNLHRRSMVAGTWSSPSYVCTTDEHGPAPWSHPRLFDATCGATWRAEVPAGGLTLAIPSKMLTG